jgi:arylsulfate sulfotransferase
MRTSFFWAVLLASACVTGGQLEPTHRPGITPTDGNVTTDTGGEVSDTQSDTGEIAKALNGTCVADPTHALRFICSVSVTPPGPVEVEFSKSNGTGPVRTHVSEVSQTEHVVWLYLMESETDYSWTARSTEQPDDLRVQGTVTTGALPDGARVTVQATGVSTASQFLVNSPCSAGGFALIVDPAGSVLWYHDFAQPGGPSIMDVVNFTEDGTVLTMLDDQVIEVDLIGQVGFHTQRNVDYFYNVHHDMVRKDGLTYILYNENVAFNGDNYVMDGVLVYDLNQTLLQDWKLFDHFQPVGPAAALFGAEDYSHANAVWIDEDDNLILSMRHLSAIAKIKGDPFAPDFGEIVWRISGDATEMDFGMDFTLTSSVAGPADFRQQHNVHRLDDGRLTLFDNRVSAAENSRVLVLSIDENALTLNIDEAYELPVHCAFQGGAWHTAAGNPVGTCAPRGAAYEFSPGVYEQASFELEVNCDMGFDNYIPRYTPLEL